MPINTVIHCNIVIYGKVQGVFFRASAQQQAKALGLVGLVRNEDDGSVYIEVEGSQKGIDNLVKWCWVGSSYARVDQVDVEQGEMQGFVSFEVE